MVVVPGLYQLRIRLRRPREIEVGALGRLRLRAGWYVYTGSARAGLVQRVSRHLGATRTLRWHIDYLLKHADAVEAFVDDSGKGNECVLHADVASHGRPIPRFGASDCRCGSHLAWFRIRPAIQLLPWERFLSRF